MAVTVTHTYSQHFTCTINVITLTIALSERSPYQTLAGQNLMKISDVHRPAGASCIILSKPMDGRIDMLTKQQHYTYNSQVCSWSDHPCVRRVYHSHIYDRLT